MNIMNKAEHLDDIAKRLKLPNQQCYVSDIPREKLAKGIVLVHNHVIPQPVLGMNGFRAWTQKLTRDLVQCRCKWAGRDLRGMRHYRVRRVPKRTATN